MKHVKLSIALLLFFGCLFLGQQIISRSIDNQQKKQDSAEVHHIKYGLFSVTEWKKQISVIIGEELNRLNLSDTHAKELKQHLEVQLDGLIDNVDKKIREKNKGSAKGWLKQSFINAVVDLKDVKSGIPEYADAILAEMTKAKTEARLKTLVKKRIDKYLEKTFEEQDLSQLTRIMLANASPDIESVRAKLSLEISQNQEWLFTLTWLLIAVSCIIFIVPLFGKEPLSPPLYIIMLLTLLVLLAVGVTTPMIDMEAKISEMSFFLMDHPIKFLNQVLYFQTKSILDVFWIMIVHEDIQMKVVGILMVAFSIIFPLLKMISSLAYYYDFRRATQSKWVQFFVLKSGKWSMTDVLIVAIFMAYIGFNGIISSQFGNFNTVDQDMVILTTNGTSLQPGFFVFLTYTILALFLSSYLTRNPANEPV